MSGITVTESTLNQAQLLHNQGNITGAYGVLAQNGDGYSSFAQMIVDENADVFGFAVHSVWERNAPGAAEVLFHDVATQHQENYLNLIARDFVVTPDGQIIHNLPDSFAIESSYVSALRDFGLPPSLAIDVLINTATGSPQWAHMLGLPAERISRSYSVLDGVSAGVAARNLMEASRNGAFNSVSNLLPTECFPANTPIQLASGKLTTIASIRAGDQVAAFDGKNFRGRGALDSKPVVQLFENITDTWIMLSFAPSATQQGEDSSLAALPNRKTGTYVPRAGGPTGTSSPATSTSPALSPNTQVTGSGPSVTTSSGSTANAGTQFNPGNGYTYTVNSDGSTTNNQDFWPTKLAA